MYSISFITWTTFSVAKTYMGSGAGPGGPGTTIGGGGGGGLGTTIGGSDGTEIIIVSRSSSSPHHFSIMGFSQVRKLKAAHVNIKIKTSHLMFFIFFSCVNIKHVLIRSSV